MKREAEIRIIEASVPFYAFKMVLELFFTEYEKTKCSSIVDYKKILNKLKNSSA